MTTRKLIDRPRPSWGWQDDAACRGEDLVLFFGPDGEREPQRTVRERKAKAICAQCPVAAECLDYALSRPEKYGLWRLNEDERASERRRRMRRAAGPVRPDPEPVTDKPCPSCGETKAADMFGSDRTRCDGLNVTCKECANAKRHRQREAKQAVA